MDRIGAEIAAAEQCRYVPASTLGDQHVVTALNQVGLGNLVGARLSPLSGHAHVRRLALPAACPIDREAIGARNETVMLGMPENGFGFDQSDSTGLFIAPSNDGFEGLAPPEELAAGATGNLDTLLVEPNIECGRVGVQSEDCCGI